VSFEAVESVAELDNCLKHKMAHSKMRCSSGTLIFGSAFLRANMDFKISLRKEQWVTQYGLAFIVGSLTTLI